MSRIVHSEKGIQMTILEYFADTDQFTTREAIDAVKLAKKTPVKEPSVRARIYEGVDKGLFRKIAKGIYCIEKNGSSCLLVQGNGRDLSFLEDDSIDCIITDHPYADERSHKGGNRNFSTYSCFQYTQEDFFEKARVLKQGCFLIEMLPDENANNFQYLYQIKKMAEAAGFFYYAKVPWVKGNFVANTDRKQKASEDILFFTKGKAKNLPPDVKKDLSEPERKHFMSGAAGMLPKAFIVQPAGRKEKIHQAEKPVSLYEMILDFVTIKRDRILDQFAGSGNLGRAALRKNRDAILIEEDKDTFIKMQSNIEEERVS